MRFRYIFQKIVDLKTGEKTQAEWKLAQSIGKLHEAEFSLDRLLAEKQAAQTLLMQSAQTKTSVADIQEIQHYIEYLDSKIAGQNAALAQEKMNVESNRHALVAKMLDEKVWTSAREQAYLRYVALFRKQEQFALDEMAAVRHQTGRTL